MRVLVMGASGSGTSTLGEALASVLGARWLDLDGFYWEPTVPPFQTKRDRSTRLMLLFAELASQPNAVLSGSAMNWGVALEDSFDVIVFLALDSATRVARLRVRELARFGHVDEEFIAWAAQYDDGTMTGRSRALHEAWLAARSAPVVRLSGALPTAAQIDCVVALVRELAPCSHG